MFVMTAEFFPHYVLVYVIDESRREIIIVFLREDTRGFGAGHSRMRG
jgi:hypothetical protein